MAQYGMMTTERTWGRYQPISIERRQRVIHYLATCPEMSFSMIAARVGVSKASVRDINRESGTRRKTKEEVH